MAERAAYPTMYVSSVEPQTRSRDRLSDFYGETPTSPVELTVVRQQLFTLMEELTAMPWAYLGEAGTLALSKLHQMSIASQFLGEATQEQQAATRLRQEFGTPNPAIYDLALPVCLELARNELSSQQVVVAIATETQRLMTDVSQLLSVLMLALQTELEKSEQERQQVTNTRDGVSNLDTEGHAEIEKGKQAGKQRLGIQVEKTSNKAALLRQTITRLERHTTNLATRGTIFSQKASTAVELSEVRAVA